MENQRASFLVWLKDLGPWIVGLLALIQVWAIEAWKQFRTGRLEIYESGNIEIGYSRFGPTVACLGTIRCLRKDVFVRRAEIQLVRRRDRAEYRFSWRAFRPTTISLNPAADGVLQVPTSFLITSRLAVPFNVIFSDEAFVARHQAEVEALVQRWQEFRPQPLATTKESNDASETASQEPVSATARFNEFLRLPEVTDAYTALDRSVYWEAGEYELTLRLECAGWKKRFSKKWSFALQEADAKRLRLNSVAIIQSVCDVPTFFNFAYAQYGDGQSIRGRSTPAYWPRWRRVSRR